MINFIFLLICSTFTFAQQMSADPLVLKVIKENKQFCRNTRFINCIKPIYKPGTDIRAIEIELTGTTKVNITLYDKNGVPHDLEPENQIQFKGVDDTLDADISIGLIPKENKSQIPIKKNR